MLNNSMMVGTNPGTPIPFFIFEMVYNALICSELVRRFKKIDIGGILYHNLSKKKKNMVFMCKSCK